MTNKGTIKILPVAEIEVHKDVQIRKVDKAVAVDYTKDMQAGDVFPPIVVFSDEGSKRYIIADGHHRLHAAERAEKPEIECQVFPGSVREALKYALGANATQGQRRTRKDLRKALEVALQDEEWGGLSNRMVADLCHCDEKTVRSVKDDLIISGKINQGEVVVGKDGVEQPATKPTGAEIPHHDEKPKKPKRKTAEERAKIELLGGLKIIRTVPYSGQVAAEKLPNIEKSLAEIKFARDWLTELIDAIDV